MSKYIPWGLVVALTLGFGLFCRQEGIAHEKNKATIAALAQTQAQLQHSLGQTLQQTDSLRGEIGKRDAVIAGLKKQERVVQGKFDSLLATWPLDSAPDSCFPYVQQVSTCQKLAQNLHEQIAQDSANRVADSLRVESWKKLAVGNKATADSLLKKWPKPSMFKDLTRPTTWVTFVAGLLLGNRLSH